ncbi:hypothetical protein DL96DRAFT_1719835 [Flagelloscypha sp. PMI_526]|nr:hypothetical protein DL96DRAFT_1719835 [Flagelloscypha sp. PMI_526]
MAFVEGYYIGGIHELSASSRRIIRIPLHALPVPNNPAVFPHGLAFENEGIDALLQLETVFDLRVQTLSNSPGGLHSSISFLYVLSFSPNCTEEQRSRKSCFAVSTGRRMSAACRQYRCFTHWRAQDHVCALIKLEGFHQPWRGASLQGCFPFGWPYIARLGAVRMTTRMTEIPGNTSITIWNKMCLCVAPTSPSTPAECVPYASDASHNQLTHITRSGQAILRTYDGLHCLYVWKLQRMKDWPNTKSILAIMEYGSADDSAVAPRKRMFFDLGGFRRNRSISNECGLQFT